MKILLASLLLLLPCYWHPRIQAGDLASHIYNVWLVQLIRSGQAPGLYLETVRTNVLFDLTAEFLIGIFGFVWGERLAVSLIVLTFFWGAFALVHRLSGASAWPSVPLLAMLSYGWVFHMGFCNFYWSLGLCFWALAMSRAASPTEQRLFWIPLIPATAAHTLPVAWAAGLWLYDQVTSRIAPPRRKYMLLAAGAAIALLSAVIQFRFPSRWAPDQILCTIGMDQLLLANMPYLLISCGFLLVCTVGAVYSAFLKAPLQEIPVHFFLLTSLSVLLIPSAIQLPGFDFPLGFITQRMSVIAGVLLCAFIPLHPQSGRLALAAIPLTCAYFGFVYRDTSRLTEVEQKLTVAVRQLPLLSKVIAPYENPETRVFTQGHLIDRACIGHCYSYANYEPATTQFRVRTQEKNDIVASDNFTSLGLQTVNYAVKPGEGPIYYFLWNDAERNFTLRILRDNDVLKR